MTEPLCERCKARPARPKEKFCKECRKVVLQELSDSGSLQRVGDRHVGQRRIGEQKELTYQTKHGTGH